MKAVVLLFVGSLGYLASSPVSASCPMHSLLAAPLSDSVAKLVEMGFALNTAQKLAAQRPDVVTQIFSDPEAGLPDTYYRTLDAEPDEFDPRTRMRLNNSSGGGPFDVSVYGGIPPTLYHLESYGRHSSRTVIGTILEFQVPLFVHKSYPACGKLQASWIRGDLTPFVRRLAPVLKVFPIPRVPEAWVATVGEWRDYP